jgi:DNA-binding NarL/FixJ family response regulator
MASDDIRALQERWRRIRDAAERVVDAIADFRKEVDGQSLEPVTEMTGLEALSESERKVLNAISEGLARGDAAARIGISPKTFDAQRDAIRKKLGIASAYDLKSFAEKLKKPT